MNPFIPGERNTSRISSCIFQVSTQLSSGTWYRFGLFLVSEGVCGWMKFLKTKSYLETNYISQKKKDFLSFNQVGTRNPAVSTSTGSMPTCHHSHY